MSSSASNSKRPPVLGCIADDVTGATDLAINLVQGGMRVVQLLTIPTVAELQEIDADAVIVALKTRSVRKGEAVKQSLAALESLRGVGIERFFFKYCSTFDSTEEGNIGPVAEALLDALEANQTIFCPAFPCNGRTVYHGHLFVHGKLLNESGMENHPLNPMTDANLVRFLGKQTQRKVGLLTYDELPTAREGLAELEREDCPLVVTDACDDKHLKILAASVANQTLVTGGSGIARYLPGAYREAGLFTADSSSPTLPTATGRSLIVAGSCSSATIQQVAWMQSKSNAFHVEVDIVLENPNATDDLVEWASGSDGTKPVMIYSSARPEKVNETQQKHGREVVANAMEAFLSTVTERLVNEFGFGKLVLAGGETSGAIVQQLGIRALRIGPEISPGIPWTESLDAQPLALALKSGNFGGEDFFERALEMLA